PHDRPVRRHACAFALPMNIAANVAFFLWIRLAADVLSAACLVIPDTFMVTERVLDVPGRFPLAKRFALERWRVRRVTAGQGRTWYRGLDYVLLIILEGGYAVCAMRGRDRGTVLATAAALRDVLGLGSS